MPTGPPPTSQSLKMLPKTENERVVRGIEGGGGGGEGGSS